MWWKWLGIVILLTGCTLAKPVVPAPTAVLQPQVTTSPPIAHALMATPLPPTQPAAFSRTPLPVPVDTPLPLPSATLTASPAPSQTPTATPDRYADLTIDALSARSYGGGLLDIVDTLERTDLFTRYLITYPSDGLTIFGYMNVPHEGSKFPVVLMLHGYIPPAEYETVSYTERYADALAEAGYFVIHPNLRNYPPSDSGANPYRIGMAVDVLNLIAILREHSQDPLGYLRRADADNIHLWGHSMGGGIALRVLTVNNREYLKSAVLYGAMSGDEQLNYERIQAWSGGARGEFELGAPPSMLAAISSINYLGRIQAKVAIHHSNADNVVPLAWSEDLCRRLQDLQKPVSCYTYHATPHTFNGENDALFIRRVINFYDQ